MYLTNPTGENELALSFRILKRYLFSYVLVLNVSCLLIFLVFVGCQLFFFAIRQLPVYRIETLHFVGASSAFVTPYTFCASRIISSTVTTGSYAVTSSTYNRFVLD